MAVVNKSISKLIDNQLPEFISTDYPKFSAFLQKYYEQLETTGQPLDIINNLTKYGDIDTYENTLLGEFSIVTSNINPSDTVISLDNTDSFPDTNGYVLIDDEIIFYKSKTSNSLINCTRNVSGTMKLGDLYTKSVYRKVSSQDFGNGASHLQGSRANNISNLFLYAFVKNFEKQYLASFPEESLKPEIDKRTLLKNIKSFYRSKGTDQSIKFIFNSIVAQDSNDIPSIYYPKENTLKTSTADWIDKYALKVKVISGDPFKIIGAKLIQEEDVYNSSVQNAFAYVDNVVFSGNYDNDSIYEIILAPETIVGEFSLAQKTTLTSILPGNAVENSRVNVFSTTGWKNTSGKISIGNEVFSYKDKTINQFIISTRTGNTTHAKGTPVYNYSNLYAEYEENGIVKKTTLLALGVLYNLNVSNSLPYASEGEVIQISNTGFETRNPVIYDKSQSKIRWILNQNLQTSNIPNLNQVLTNVAAIHEDEQYYYISSSGYPSYSVGNFANVSFNDQKFLKLIKKESVKTTELNYTSTRDVGLLLNGVPLYGYKDYDTNDVIFGGLESITVTEKGGGYKNPPYVLIDGDKGAVAKAMLSGEVVERIEIQNAGEKYTTNPQVTITSGRNAIVTATVTKDQVTKLTIVNAGEYYSTPPIVRIRDLNNVGRLAEYTSIISTDGKLIGFNKINEGKFYTQDNIVVDIIPVGSGAQAKSITKRWKKNRFENIQKDNQNGYYFENIEKSLGYGYAHVANPVALRTELLDNNPNVHSPIIGYAYDGNPIYGPYGYSDATNPSSSIKRMETSYRLKTSRINGPSTTQYPLGKFVEDFYYQHRFGDLDENNGRYCITPDYPDGVYAYFITIDSNETPKFPYILGEKFYSIPTESNYTTSLTHNDISAKAIRLRTADIPNNGVNAIATIETVKEGSVSSSVVDDSTDYFSVGNTVFVSNTDTSGYGATVEVASLEGKQIQSIEAWDKKVLKFESKNPVYYFDKSIITQENTNASGEVVGNIFSDNIFVLRNVSGTFNRFDKLNSNVRVVNLIVDKASYYTAGYNLTLTNGKEVNVLRIENNTLITAYNPFINEDRISFPTSSSGIIANKIYYVTNATSTTFRISETLNGPSVSLTNRNSFGVVASSEEGRGEILETVSDSNTVKLRVIDGNFFTRKELPTGSGNFKTDYYLKGSLIDDTVGSKIVKLDELSKNIEIFAITDNVALVETSQPHNLTIGDSVSIDINPNNSTTTTNIHVRKRIYQTVKLFTPTVQSFINDTGIGSIKRLSGGVDYANGASQTFSNVELIFADQSRCRDINGRLVAASKSYVGAPGALGNAKATITITNGTVGENGVVITTKGSAYQIGDILTVSNSSLNRSNLSLAQNVLYLEVTHVGLGKNQTEVILSNVDNISVQDIISIGDENARVISIDENKKSLILQRAVNNTVRKNHPNNTKVINDKPQYQFTVGRRLGNSSGDPIILEYIPESQLLTVIFDTNQVLDTVNKINFNTTFFDDGVPPKLVKVDSIIEDAEYRFEFSYTPTVATSWLKNPIIEIQKYYTYKFITSHPSLSGSFLEFSPSRNKNIIMTESRKGSALPGTGTESSSFVEIKLGFGAFSPSNNFTEKKESNYTNFYYYDKAGIVNSNNSYLQLIDDPLQGEKTVNYVSPNYFAYLLDKKPSYDGTGNFSYTTKSLFAVGKISSLKISSGGKQYKKIPTIIGVKPNKDYECIANLNYDEDTGKIVSVSIENNGKNYSKPVVIIQTQSGEIEDRITFDIVKSPQGEISAILPKQNNVVFSEKPLIYVAESNVKIYLESKTIGQPKNIRIMMNGSNYYNDTSISSSYTSYQIVSIKNFLPNAFVNGEIIRQYENGFLIAEGKIVEEGFRKNTNYLKISNVIGEFKKNLIIRGSIKKNTALVTNVFFSVFTPNIKSYYDNLGYFSSDRGKLSLSSQKIADSYFYQDYSYVVKSKTPINIWKKLVEQTVHPAGLKLFGELDVETAASTRMPTDQKITTSISVVELWNEKTNKVTIESTRRQITQTVVQLTNTTKKRGVGSVYTTDFDTSEMLAYDIVLQQPFDGNFDESGNIVGRKTFTMVVPNGGPLNVANVNNLMISIDGIFQEPGKAFTVSGSSITFARAPLGPRISNNQLIEPQKFVGRMIRFKQSSFNEKYFKKIKNIESLFGQIDPTTKKPRNRFPLYYEDGTNVVLESNENLIVSLDGVIQESKVTPLIPGNAAYYINRTVVPNEIVFVDAPRKLDNDNRSKFFAFSVGKYERIKLDAYLFDGQRKGPFLLKSVLNNKPINVDTDKAILVFVDGVLQIRNRSYSIIGSDIYFTDAPRFGQKINILYVYGFDFENKLTFFNYENNRFFNLAEITLSGNNYSFKEFFEKSTVYQGNSLPSWEAVGEVVSYSATPGQSTTKILIKQQNYLFTTTKDLKFSGLSRGLSDYVIPASNIVSISEFKEDEDRNDLIYEAKSPWLFGTSLKPEYIKNIDIGDLIKIDGETEYRRITSLPETLKKVGHNQDDLIASNHFGSLGVTSTNSMTSGIGLSVQANILNGKIESLSWNNKDYTKSFITKQNNSIIVPKVISGRYQDITLNDQKIVRLRNNTTISIINRTNSSIEIVDFSIPPITAYGYEENPQLVFVPQPPRDSFGNITGPVSGGGASGYVVMDRGEIIDVVLTSKGSGYNAPPKIYVTKGYDIIKSAENLVNISTDLYLSPKIKVDDSTIYQIITISPAPSLTPSIETVSDVRSQYNTTNPTIIITPPPRVAAITEVKAEIIKNLDTAVPEVATIVDTYRQINNVFDISPLVTTYITYNKESTQIVEFGTLDIFGYEGLNPNKYQQGKLGNTFGVFESIKFVDNGSAKTSNGNYISAFTLGELELDWTDLTIEDFENIQNTSYKNNKYWNYFWHTIQDNGAILDSGLTPTDTIIYIPNTSRFASSGKLLIGDEIISYTSKLSDRFMGVTRGVDNTTPKSHNPGDYLRSIV